MTRLLARTWNKLWTLGPWETLGIVRKNCLEWAKDYLDRHFDRRYGVDTGGQLFPADLDIESENRDQAIQYEPTPIRTLRSALANLPARLDGFVFIDFGSGKGRTLLVASDYPFKRIIGVEFARDLHAIAERNIKIYRRRQQRCFQIESVHMDAAVFPLPLDPLVLYFYFPFKEGVMVKVLDSIEASYRARRRRIVVLYYYSQLAHLLEARSFLGRRPTKPLPFDPLRTSGPYRNEIRMYETEP